VSRSLQIRLKQTAEGGEHVQEASPSLNGFSRRGWDRKRDGTTIEPGFVSQRNGTFALKIICKAVRGRAAGWQERWQHVISTGGETARAVACNVNGPKISQPRSWRSLCTARSAIASEPTIRRRHPPKLQHIVAPLQGFFGEYGANDPV